MPSHRRWSISAVTSPQVASTRHTFCRLRSGREPGTRVHTIPNPFATSIAAAYSTTCVLSSATSAPSPPCTGIVPRAPSPALLFFAFFFPADIAASLSLETGRNQLPGERRGKKPNLIGVLEGDSTPARMIAPSAKLSCGHQSAKQNTASRAACQADRKQPQMAGSNQRPTAVWVRGLCATWRDYGEWRDTSECRR